MAKNWTAYEAAKEIYGDNKENIAEIGSRFPLFARTIAILNNDYVLDILKAIPKVTARVVETGLKEMGVDAEVETDAETEVDEKPVTVKRTKKAKSAVEEDEEEAGTYESMTSKELYALCCKRGISSKCKSRSKDALIELLNKYDAGELDDEPKAKTSRKSKSAKKAEPIEDDTDDEDWDEEEEEEEKDPYAGKTAKELFAMCKERGLKTKPKQSAETYAKLLKADDATEDAEDDEEDEDDEWEI